jgi:hypothetical protein
MFTVEQVAILFTIRKMDIIESSLFLVLCDPVVL